MTENSMPKQAITADEYNKEFCETKTVELPSHKKAEIKRITLRQYEAWGGKYLREVNDLVRDAKTQEERASIITKTMTPEEKEHGEEILKKMVIHGTVNPVIGREKKPGQVCIDDILDPDYYALVDAITEFSFGDEYRQKFFRSGAVAKDS